MKKILASALAVLMVLAFWGCSKSAESESAGSKSKEKKVVSFYVWAADAEQVFDKAIVAQYEAEHPDVDIDDNYIPYGEYLSKINTMAAAGSMPDIFNLPEGNVFEWGEKGAVRDLKPLYEEAGVKPTDIALEQVIFQTQDSVWSVGYNITTMCLYYNKELLRENGITPPSADAGDPWTWAEYVDAARKITKDSNGKTPNDVGFDPDSIQVYGTKMPTAWVGFMPLLYSNNAGIATRDGKKLAISSPEGLEVVQAIADLSQVDYCAPTNAMATGAFADASAMLMNNQLGMVIDGGWALSNYTNEGFDVGVAQIPAFKQPANMSWTAGLCMSPDLEDYEAAFDFYQYFTNFNNSIQTALDQGVSLGGLPHTLAVFDGGENEAKWVSTYDKTDASEALSAFKGILLNEGTRLGENVALKNFPEIVDNTLIPLLDNVWLGELTAQEALGSLNMSAVLEGTWRN